MKLDHLFRKYNLPTAAWGAVNEMLGPCSLVSGVVKRDWDARCEQVELKLKLDRKCCCVSVAMQESKQAKCFYDDRVLFYRMKQFPEWRWLFCNMWYLRSILEYLKDGYWKYPKDGRVFWKRGGMYMVFEWHLMWSPLYRDYFRKLKETEENGDLVVLELLRTYQLECIKW